MQGKLLEKTIVTFLADQMAGQSKYSTFWQIKWPANHRMPLFGRSDFDQRGLSAF
jgi:hypothetical protein